METQTCPTCGSTVPVNDGVCERCGTRLRTATDATEIRRFVTVVTSDLKGSTALGERFDPETLRELLGLYFDDMRVVFESNGGRIEKIIGDAIVAVFGPTADPIDDALRGLEAAAQSQQALATLNDRLEATWGVRLVARTGAASGDVLFGEAARGQQVLTGPTMLIATAMEQHCPPLEVLISGSTRDLVGDRVEAEFLGLVTPKGTDLAIPSFRLLAVGARSGGDRPSRNLAAAGVSRCPACGTEGPEGSAACGTCGQTLVRVAVAPDTRKTVTIVFADPKPRALDGSPPTPEALRDVMPRYFEAMKAALEHHGGTVEKFIGDAVMAVYGLPVRHEDDAVRAVRAAAAMQASLPDLNAEFARDWGLEVRNHIGVNTGEVIAGDASLGQRLVTGDAVNTAARLEQAAGAQEVILGHLTYLLARDQIEVERIEPLALKGKAEPVPAYRLVAVRQRPAERVAAATPFVGRAAEMAKLRDALLDAKGHKAARLITVIGDAGVGKSRLVREFAGSLGDEAYVLRGRCLPYGDGITFWPIGEIVRTAAAITDDDDAGEALAKIALLVDDESLSTGDAGEVAARVGAAIGLSTEQFQLPELFWAIRRLFESMARQRTLVAIIDDVQWAAPAFLELVDHLLEVASDAPILVLATARHELFEAHGEWSAGHAERQLVLQPLSDAHATEIIDRILDGLDASVRHRIAGAAEGNPLYVEQIAAMLVETGALRREGGVWVTAASSGEVAIPPTVQALVAARLDALPRDERAVIEPASVIGLSFARDAVQDLLEADLYGTVPQQLASLTSKQLVRVATGSDEDVYRFGHLVIRDTVYGGLLKRVRAVLHERFVQWAERVNAERGRGDEFEEILGYHLQQAYRYRTELGPVDEHARSIARSGAAKLSNAGRRASSRGDVPAAVSLLRSAASLLIERDVDRVELLGDLAFSLMAFGALEEASTVLAEAAAIAAERQDPRLTARVQVAQVSLDRWAARGSASAYNERARTLVATLDPLGDHWALSRAWREVVTAEFMLGHLTLAADAADRVVAHARQANELALVPFGARAVAYSVIHGATPVRDGIRRCEQLLDDLNADRTVSAVVLLALAQLRAMDGSFEDARGAYRRAQAILAEVGARLEANSTSIDTARIELLAGDLAAAEEELTRDDEALAAMDEKYFRSTVAALLANVLALRGKVADAERVAGIAEGLADEDDVLSQVLWRTARAKVEAARGHAEEALGLAGRAVELARESDEIGLLADALTELGRTEILLARHEKAGPPLEEALQLYTRKGDRSSADAVTRLLAEAALGV